jgi:hypothetical protein
MIRFDHSRRQLRENEVMLKVNPAVLDRAFRATNPDQYQHHPGKVANFSKPMIDDAGEQVRVRMPRIGAFNGRIGFENGRHRALAAKLQGLKLIPVAVHRDHVAELRRLLASYRTDVSARRAPL